MLCVAGFPAFLVVPLTFRAPEAPASGLSRCVCRWAAARPLAVRAASFARRVVSKPGQALTLPQVPKLNLFYECPRLRLCQ